MIASGVKTEEYREIKRYWDDRLQEDSFGRFHEVVQFRNGYHRDAPKMRFDIEDIKIATGNPEWGAEPGKKYYVIQLGKRL